MLHDHLKKFKDKIYSWIHNLANICRLSSDTEDQRLRKAVLVMLAGIYIVLGLLWGGVYLVSGFFLPGSIPLAYSFISGAVLLYFLRSKNYAILCYVQLILILFLPFFFQWSLGGFAVSGAVVIWGILSPIGALMFAGTMRSVPWFLAYLMLLIISGFVGEKNTFYGPIPSFAITVIFVMNIGGVSAIVFFLLKYFVGKRERAMATLDSQHRQVRHSLSLAMEVQQNLLPKGSPAVKGLDIAGKSLFCDETGGDYYDYLEGGNQDQGKIKIVVGDVSDHGIPSALLMATVRAVIHQRSSLPGSISEIASDVNCRLLKDVEDSGRFMSMFFAEFDRQNNLMHWLNAGHEPAIVYDPATDSFDELSGRGSLPLGVSEDIAYTEAQRDLEPGQIIAMATDGIREAQNRHGEMFGKQSFKNVIRRNASASADRIQQAVFTALDLFQYGIKSEDDMTLVVIKVVQDS